MSSQCYYYWHTIPTWVSGRTITILKQCLFPRTVGTVGYVACSKPLIISSVHPIASLNLPWLSNIDGATLSTEGFFWGKQQQQQQQIFGNIYGILSQEGMFQTQHLQGFLSRAQRVVRTPCCKINVFPLGQGLSQTRSKMLCTDWVQQERAGKYLLALHFRSLSAAM